MSNLNRKKKPSNFRESVLVSKTAFSSPSLYGRKNPRLVEVIVDEKEDITYRQVLQDWYISYLKDTGGEIRKDWYNQAREWYDENITPKLKRELEEFLRCGERITSTKDLLKFVAHLFPEYKNLLTQRVVVK